MHSLVLRAAHNCVSGAGRTHIYNKWSDVDAGRTESRGLCSIRPVFLCASSNSVHTSKDINSTIIMAVENKLAAICLALDAVQANNEMLWVYYEDTGFISIHSTSSLHADPIQAVPKKAGAAFIMLV